MSTATATKPDVDEESETKQPVTTHTVWGLGYALGNFHDQLRPALARLKAAQSLLYMEDNSEGSRLDADEQWAVMTIIDGAVYELAKFKEWADTLRPLFERIEPYIKAPEPKESEAAKRGRKAGLKLVKRLAKVGGGKAGKR